MASDVASKAAENMEAQIAKGPNLVFYVGLGLGFRVYVLGVGIQLVQLIEVMCKLPRKWRRTVVPKTKIPWHKK